MPIEDPGNVVRAVCIECGAVEARRLRAGGLIPVAAPVPAGGVAWSIVCAACAPGLVAARGRRQHAS